MRIFKTFAVALVLVLVFAFVLNKKLDAGDRETAKLEKKLETALTVIDRLKKAAKDALKREKELEKKLETALTAIDRLKKAAKDALKREKELEKKLETALTAIDRLEKAAKDALKREKELEKKLETALTAIDRLEKAAKKAAKDALKREKELVKRGENLAKQMSAKLKELASLVAADMDQIGEDMKKELVPAMTKLVLPLNKRNRELAAELDNLHKYDKELAAWLKERDKELVVALTEDLEKYDKELAAELDKLGLDMTEHVRIGWLNQKLDELRAYQKLLETGLRWRITNHTHEVTGSPLNREAYPCFPNQLCP